MVVNTVTEAMANLSSLLERVEQGEEVMINQSSWKTGRQSHRVPRRSAPPASRAPSGGSS